MVETDINRNNRKSLMLCSSSGYISPKRRFGKEISDLNSKVVVANGAQSLYAYKIKSIGRGKQQEAESLEVTSRIYRHRLSHALAGGALDAADSKEAFLQNIAEELYFDPVMAREIHKEFYRKKLQQSVADIKLNLVDVAALRRLRVLLCIPQRIVEAAHADIFGSLFEKANVRGAAMEASTSRRSRISKENLNPNFPDPGKIEVASRDSAQKLYDSRMKSIRRGSHESQKNHSLDSEVLKGSHGTTQAGMMWPPFFLLATDTKESVELEGTLHHLPENYNKIIECCKIFIAQSGPKIDVELVRDYIKEEIKDAVSVASALTVQQCAIKTFEYIKDLKMREVEFLFAGFEDQRPYMAYANSADWCMVTDFHCIGTGGHFAYPSLRRAYDDGIQSVHDLILTARLGIRQGKENDPRTGDHVRVLLCFPGFSEYLETELLEEEDIHGGVSEFNM